MFVLYFEACLQIINTVLMTCMIMLDNKAWWLLRIVMTYTTGPIQSVSGRGSVGTHFIIDQNKVSRVDSDREIK